MNKSTAYSIDRRKNKNKRSNTINKNDLESM